jgi:RNA polymerase sigma factor (sigma-70 family)
MSSSLSGVLSYLRGLAPAELTGEEDGPLLSRFVKGDSAAFTLLVGRYTPLVWGVCRRLLGPSPDAEDAFQATFVVLVRKATSLSGGQPLGPWLHRVAWRTATKARARSARRQARETLVEVDPAVSEACEVQQRELSAVLDEEVSRLPERYRRPVVLCYLEGLTNEEAARRLDCPRGRFCRVCLVPAISFGNDWPAAGWTCRRRSQQRWQSNPRPRRSWKG